MMDGGSVWRKACVLAFIMDFGGGLLSLAVPMLAVQMGARAETVGAVGSTALAGYTLFCFLSQPLTDRWGRKFSMMLGSVAVTLFCMALIGTALTRSLWLLGIANLMVGVSYAFFWPPTQAMAGFGVSPTRLLSVLRFYNLSWSGGRMLGTGLAGMLFEKHPFLPFSLAAAVSGMVAIGVWFLRFPDGAERFDPEETGSNNDSEHRLAIAAQLGNFVRSFAVIEAVVLFPKLGKQWGWTEGDVSTLLFLVFVGHLVAFTTAPFVIRTVNWQWVMGVKVGVSGLAVLLGLLSDRFPLAVVLFALGIAAGLTTVVSLYLSITTQGQSVKGSARHEAGVGAGGVFGPILGGIALGHGSPLIAFTLPLMLAMALLLFWDLPTLMRQAKTPTHR